MSPESVGARLVPDDQPDRVKWNARFAAGFSPSFTAHPLAARSLALALPDGPVADLACGPSGTALLAAAHGRHVTAVDISEVALGFLGAEARRRGLGDLITLVHTDLSAWQPEPRSYALVLCTGFWDRAVFAAAADAVAPGGLLAWEAFTIEARLSRPSLAREWCLAAGEPAPLLPPGFTVLNQSDVPAPEQPLRRQMIARRTTRTVPLWHGCDSVPTLSGRMPHPCPSTDLAGPRALLAKGVYGVNRAGGSGFVSRAVALGLCHGRWLWV
jgi:SAM-dependent methyltransferase